MIYLFVLLLSSCAVKPAPETKTEGQLCQEAKYEFQATSIVPAHDPDCDLDQAGE